MRFLRGCGVALVAASVCWLGCSSANLYPPPPPCEGPGCATNPVGGSTPTTSSGGVGGAGGAIGAGDVLGTVDRFISPTFQDSETVFNAAATILALPSGGAMISTPYGGAAGTTFTLPSVPPGLTWLWVRDETAGGAGVLSTFSQTQLPALTPIVLPVIDLGMMNNIAANLPSVAAKGVSSLAAHVILILSHGNAPYNGVAVTGGAAGAQIVYDLGPGAYTDSGTATGTAGRVILFNGGFSGTSVVLLTDTATTPAKQYSVPIRAATGSATIVVADLE